jgi:hypothetical protein
VSLTACILVGKIRVYFRLGRFDVPARAGGVHANNATISVAHPVEPMIFLDGCALRAQPPSI